MHVLGISAFHHDSAAALLHDGEIVAAAQEERFTRTKQADAFPREAVRWCLEAGGVRAEDVDFIGFHEKPMWRFERLIETWIAFAPAGFGAFKQSLPRWLGRRLHVARELDRELGLKKKPYVFAPHHESHAAAAFFPSPFEEAAILTLDGAGEWATTTIGRGRANKIEIANEIRYPHSIGLLYAAFAAYLGFGAREGFVDRPESSAGPDARGGEQPLMALSVHGEPRFAALILEKIVDLKPDGSFWVDMQYFRYCHGDTQTSKRFHALFGGPPRHPDAPIEQRHKDIAASIQRVTEEIVLRIARHLHDMTGSKNLVMAGGVAQNVLANARLAREGPFENVWVQPAPGNAGSALGVALLIHHQLLDRARKVRSAADPDGQSGSLLGPAFAQQEIESFLREAGATHTVLRGEARDARIAELIAAGKVVATFQGRLEFGQHALGARSVLADPRRAELRDVLNARVKFREPFRAFTPIVLASRANGATAGATTGQTTGAGVMQVGESARMQAVDAGRHPALAGVLRAFERATGCPVLLETSFSIGADPVVRSPEDAWRAFLSSEIDALVLEDALVLKSEQRAEIEARASEGVREKDAALASLLRCPACGDALSVDGERATCARCAKTYPREEGIWKLFQPSEPFDGDVTALVKSFYEDHPFPNYDEDESLRSLMEKARRGVYARLLGEQLPTNARVLEVGCGTGQLSNFLGIGCRTVVGADLCLNSLRLAEKFRSGQGLKRVRFLQMNLFRPAFAPGSFDVVLCNGVLLTTRDPRGGFESIAKLVKPGGHIVIGLYNTWGRLAVDSRRVFFRVTGGRMRWIDPHLRKLRMSKEKQDAWFHDQYRHPHETKQSMGEVLGWFEENGFEFVSAVPKTNPWEPFSEQEDLFTPTSEGTALDRGLAQAKMIVTSAREGGFFIMIGRKKERA